MEEDQNVTYCEIYQAAISGSLLDLPLSKLTACLNFRTPEGNNVCHIVCEHNRVDIIKRTLHFDAHHPAASQQQRATLGSLLLLTNSVNETPFHTAVRYGATDIVKLLVEHFKTRYVSDQQNLEQHSSSSVQEQGHGEGEERPNCTVLQKLLGIRSSNEEDTVLHIAIRNGYEDIAIYLLKEAEPKLAEFVNVAGESPLYLAAEYRCFDVIEKILNGNTDYREGGPDGQNPLHAAVKCASASVCNLLIKNKPGYLQGSDQKGKTPLHLAVENKQEKVVKILLDQKEDPSKAAASIHDEEGFTPLLRAAMNGYFSIIQMILARYPKSAADFHKMNERNVIHLLGNMSCRKLRNCIKFLESLVDMINEPFKDGNTPLDLSIIQGAKDKAIAPLEMQESLVSIINKPDKDGNTPLHLSIIQGDKDKAIALLGMQIIDWRVENLKGETPMDLLETLKKKFKVQWDSVTDEADSPDLTSQQDLTTDNQRNSPQGSAPTSKQDKMTYVHLCLIRHAIQLRDSVLHPLAVKSKRSPSYNTINLFKESLVARKRDELKQIMDGITVVATLVVTLTFAAAFQIPGGYNNKTGSILLINKPSLKIFFYADTIAMLLCTLIMLDYAWANITIRHRELCSKVFMQVMALSVSLVFTIIAFTSGLYAVLLHSQNWFAHTVSGATFLSMILMLFRHPINLLFVRFPINLSFLQLPIIYIGPLSRVGKAAFYDFQARKAKRNISQ